MLGVHPKEKPHEVVTWRRSAVDISCTPGWPCPETRAQKAEKAARGKAQVIIAELENEQLYKKAFSSKASTAVEAIKQLRLYADAVEKYDLPDKPGMSLYSPHAGLPKSWGAPWEFIEAIWYRGPESENISSIAAINRANKYGYIKKFFPDIEIAPHGYQIFAFLFNELTFPGYGKPRMKAEAVVGRIKKMEEYLTAIPGDIGNFNEYNSAVGNWARDFSVGPKTFNTRVDNLILMLKAWNGVPWPHKFFSTFLPKPRVAIPAFVGQFTFSNPAIALSSYFPTTVDDIQGDIATYLIKVQPELAEHFDILLMEKIKKMEAVLKAKEKVMEVMQYFGVLMSIIGMMAGAPGAFMLVVFTIPKAIFNYAALKDLTSTQRSQAKEIFALLDFTEDNIETLRLWIADRAELPPVLPQAPGGVGKYALWIEDEFIGRSDSLEELITYAMAVGTVGQKVELGDEEAGEPAGVGVITDDPENPIEWMPESLAGKFQNLTGSERADIADSLTKKRGEFPWWLIGVPIAALVVSS